MGGATVDMRPEVDFDELYRAHHRRVLQLCRHLLISAAEAEDAAHEAFVRAQASFEQFDGDRSFLQWILGIASHHCVDRLRRRSTEQRLFSSEDIERVAAAAATPSPLEALIGAERARELQDAVASLPVKYRVPLALTYFSELSYEETGALLGLRRGHVAVLVYRGKQQLRQMLKAGTQMGKSDDMSR